MTAELEPFVTPFDEKSEELRAIVEPTIDGQGCELIDLHLVRGDSSTTVRLFIGAQKEAITLKQLEDLNRLLGDILDVEDGHRGLFRGAYHLEVSSPGVDRRLGKRSHFTRAVGERVKVATRIKVGPSKSLVGKLGASDDDGFQLKLDDQSELTVRWPELDHAHVVYQFATRGAPERKRKKKKSAKKA